MQLPESIPHDWTNRILTLLLGALGGGTILKLTTLFLNKGKRKADVAVRNAEADNLKLDALGKSESMIDRLQTRLNHLEAQSDEREKRCQEQIRFLETSVSYGRQMLNAYIKRGHEYNSQLNLMVLYLTGQAASLAVAAERLKTMQNAGVSATASELTELILLVTPAPLTIKKQEDINSKYPLPSPPDGVESLTDSGEFRKPS